MPPPILIDTDVMIDFLRGETKAVALLKKNSDRVILSSIVVAELYAGARGAREQETLDAIVNLFRVVSVSTSIAKEGGLLKNEFARSHGTGLADALIAATALAEGAVLKTLNTKHYPMFKKLKPPYTKS